MSITVNGTNGLTFSDASTQNTAASGFGFKNRIINGDMRIDQRNAGAAKTITGFTGYGGSAYTLDRWVAYSAGGTGATFTAQRITSGYGVYNLKLTVTAVNSGTILGVYQRIESTNCSDLTAATVTLSAEISCDTAQTVTWTAYTLTGAADTWTGPGVSSTPATNATAVATGTWSVGIASNTFTATFALDTNAHKGVQILIQRTLTATGQTLTVGKVQLEKGSTATSFDYRPYGTELALCQRYLPVYVQTPAPAGGYASIAGVIPVTTAVQIGFAHQVVPRTPPTGLYVSSPAHFTMYNGAFNAPPSAITLTTSTLSTATLGCAITGGSIGSPCALYINNALAQIYGTGCEL